MKNLWATAAVLALLSACNGTQPFFDETDGTDGGGGVDGGDADGGDSPGDEGTTDDPLDTGTTIPPGADEPSSSGGIVRLEARTEADSGGFVSSVRYQETNDRFIVDGLGFDGANTYSRGDPVGSLNGYAVYEADVTARDNVTGDLINQITPYRALYGVSNSVTDDGDPLTSFAIVRTGGYVNFGFGGFLYERNGAVTIPETGQAVFSGDYAGIRVFEGRGGLEYTTGDMEIAIDFRDFNTNRGIRGTIDNRRAFDIAGEEITLGGDDNLVLPELRIVIEGTAETLTANGEVAGEISSFIIGEDGLVEEYETGTYYGIVAGDATTADSEVVGVVVVTSTDPRDQALAQETGGFILTRGTDN